MADQEKSEEKKQTYCCDCHLWTPRPNFLETLENAVKGRCRDLKKVTMRLDYCDTDKIPKKKEAKAGGE